MDEESTETLTQLAEWVDEAQDRVPGRTRIALVVWSRDSEVESRQDFSISPSDLASLLREARDYGVTARVLTRWLREAGDG